MPSIHVIRWIQNINESDHQLYWFDILSKGSLEEIKNLDQITNWAERKLPPIKGEYLLYKNFPWIYFKIQPFLQVTITEKLEKIIQEIMPDVVHSFEMQSCSYPILKIMQKFSNVKWLYSCWGSDLFYYQNYNNHKVKIIKVLNRINYLHTDCQRDYNIAKRLGFSGKHVGVIPGGGGYEMSKYEQYKKTFNSRKIIVVKGYEHKFGRALKVVEALKNIKEELHDFQVIIFGAHEVISKYVKVNNLQFIVYPKDAISHHEILEIMGKSAIYIGNSISDGMPNTLLEAMFMGCFPIQSNPGGVTAEIIKNGKNGIFIEKSEDADYIKEVIIEAVQNVRLREIACSENQLLAKTYLDYHLNQQKILSIYEKIEEE